MVQDQLIYAYETVLLLQQEYPADYARLRQSIGLTEGRRKCGGGR